VKREYSWVWEASNRYICLQRYPSQPAPYPERKSLLYYLPTKKMFAGWKKRKGEIIDEVMKKVHLMLLSTAKHFTVAKPLA
jgi:hypothetical protein